jgi:hypothetical protein
MEYKLINRVIIQERFTARKIQAQRARIPFFRPLKKKLYSSASNATTMQLPRGTFSEIRKNVAIASLLHELDREKFSGVADISSQSLTGTLVFSQGNCILVKFQDSKGDTGWDDVQKAGSDVVDAALSLLDNAQIDLALEFNKPCQILKSGKYVPAQAARGSAPPVFRESPRSFPAQKTAAPVASLKSKVKSPPSHHHHHVTAPPTTTPRVPARAPPPLHPSTPARAFRYEDGNTNKPYEPPEKEYKPPEKDNDISSFDIDLDTLNTMGMVNLTAKIRTDCVTMIKVLDLEHLIER